MSENKEIKFEYINPKELIPYVNNARVPPRGSDTPPDGEPARVRRGYPSAYRG